jgi:WD40 repeat protein
VWEKITHLKEIEWQSGPAGIDSHFHFKNLYKTIQRHLIKLERNWRTGNCTTRKFDCGLWDTPFALSDKYLVAAQEDFTIKLWNRKSWDCEKDFRGHEGFVYCLQIYQNSLISGSRDKTIKVWDLETTELVSCSLYTIYNLIICVNIFTVELCSRFFRCSRLVEVQEWISYQSFIRP